MKIIDIQPDTNKVYTAFLYIFLEEKIIEMGGSHIEVEFFKHLRDLVKKELAG